MAISQDKMSLALINERETIAKIICVSGDVFFFFFFNYTKVQQQLF